MPDKIPSQVRLGWKYHSANYSWTVIGIRKIGWIFFRVRSYCTGAFRLVFHVNQWNKCIVLGVTVQYSFSCPGGYFTIDFDFSNSPIVSLTVLRIAAATTCAFPFEGEYCVNCKILWVCIFCDWISFFGLPIKSYSGLRLLVYKKYALKEPDHEPDSRFAAYRAFGVQKHQE